jgi:hypothetical protein
VPCLLVEVHHHIVRHVGPRLDALARPASKACRH